MEKAERMVRMANEYLIAYRKYKSFLLLGKKEACVECVKILIGEFGKVCEERNKISIEWFV